MAPQFDLVVVGMGSGGGLAAELAASLGLKVCAVEGARVGGDCLWSGCVPSKTLLASGRAAHAVRTAGRFGVRAGAEPEVDLDAVWARIADVQAQIAATDDDPEHWRRAGVDVRLGMPARLSGKHTVLVGDEKLTTRFVLLATGSRPALPPISGLAEAQPLTTETLWESRPPPSLLILGAGATGVELAQGLGRLGVKVTLLESAPRILAGEEPALAATLTDVLRHEGVEIVTGVEIERVTRNDAGSDGNAGSEEDTGSDVGTVTAHGPDGRSWTAAAILVATGRRPAIDGPGLDAAGVAHTELGITVDRSLRTNVRSIYACGDVTGRHLLTPTAAADGARAVRNMFFPGRDRSEVAVARATFTDPEIASVGLTEEQACGAHGADAVQVWSLPLRETDRGRIDRATDGALLVVTVKGRVVGGHGLAPAAGELIGELALAVREKAKLADLGSIVHVYPAYATAIAQLGGRAAFSGAQRLRFLVRSRASG